MTDLPVCRLCGCDPAHYPLPSGEQKHHCATRECTLHCVLMTSEQWNALMGVDRDAARYRWLRDPCSGAERIVMYSRGDYGRGLMSGTMMDSVIDDAMKGEG